MSLTDYQIKNPLKQTGKNSISYVERSFLNGNIEEIQQWYDTGIINRIMNNDVRTLINYPEHLGTALLKGAKSGKLTDDECLQLWKQLWESGAKDRTENFDTWVKDARGSTLDFLVANGANPNATFYNFYGATNLVIQLISERKSSSYPPKPIDTTHDERILEFIQTQPPSSQKLLDETLAQVLRAFNHSEDTGSDKRIYELWRDALLEKGANPLTEFMSKFSLSLKTIDNPMSSREVREYLLTLGEIPYNQAKDKITQEEQRRSEEKRIALIKFVTPIFNALPDKISANTIDINQWTEILSVKGMGAIAKILMSKGASPWQTKNNKDNETISIMLGYSQKRNYKVLQGLKEIKDFTQNVSSEWFKEALIPYIQSSTEQGSESMLTAENLDTLHDIIRAIPSTDSKNGISSRFNLLAEKWFKEIPSSKNFNEANVSGVIAAWRKYGVPQNLGQDITKIGQFEILTLRETFSKWMRNAEPAEVLTKNSQIKHPGIFKFFMSIKDPKIPIHLTSQYLKQALDEDKELEDLIISEVTYGITSGSEPEKILAHLEVINQAGGKTAIENSTMDLRDTVTALVNMGCSSTYSPYHIEGISRNIFEICSTLDATEMLDTMITYEHSLASLSQLQFISRTSGCIPMMNVLLDMGADPTAIKIYERGGAISAALKDILLMQDLNQNTPQAGNKNNKKLRL